MKMDGKEAAAMAEVTLLPTAVRIATPDFEVKLAHDDIIRLANEIRGMRAEREDRPQGS